MSKFFTTEKGSLAGLDFYTVKSDSLGHRADVCVYLPHGEVEDIPVVILLHGVYGSHWAWSLKGEVHTTLENMLAEGEIPPMLLVMPSDGLYGDGSGYLAHQNADFEKWIAYEVPSLIRENYPQVSSASPFFLTGLSMGGYGALRIGAKFPEIFRAFSGMSSITRFEQMEQFIQDYKQLKSEVQNEENVLEVLQENKDTLNPFRFDCGKDDQLFEANQKLHKELLANGIKHDFFAYEGEHSWDYWKEHIRDSLLFFAQNK